MAKLSIHLLNALRKNGTKEFANLFVRHLTGSSLLYRLVCRLIDADGGSMDRSFSFANSDFPSFIISSCLRSNKVGKFKSSRALS